MAAQNESLESCLRQEVVVFCLFIVYIKTAFLHSNKRYRRIVKMSQKRFTLLISLIISQVVFLNVFVFCESETKAEGKHLPYIVYPCISECSDSCVGFIGHELLSFISSVNTIAYHILFLFSSRKASQCICWRGQ